VQKSRRLTHLVTPMDIRDQFLNLGTLVINVTQVRFWDDTWLGGQPLKDHFPSLFNIIQKKNSIIDEVLC
jgi:hypothetical protein